MHKTLTLTMHDEISSTDGQLTEHIGDDPEFIDERWMMVNAIGQFVIRFPRKWNQMFGLFVDNLEQSPQTIVEIW